MVFQFHRLRHVSTTRPPPQAFSTARRHSPHLVASKSSHGHEPTESPTVPPQTQALQRQQLEFCCIVCGWDVACSTCPFQWFGFDAKTIRSKRRSRSRTGHTDADVPTTRAHERDLKQAMDILEIRSSAGRNGIATELPTLQQVKDAFRAKALEWHPDCNSDPRARTQFPKLLRAYELLRQYAR
ncbi:unnamed protein product [Hyaloperonospora brassicae]|uniref:J domain-containing protein n=1 Tax=Hyaloperonospora brassicae TaxID=162125 RepID=A0AAV0UUR5_HYABA|nr:unnamed protein product [Hyaloperonospora brassicae]